MWAVPNAPTFGSACNVLKAPTVGAQGTTVG